MKRFFRPSQISLFAGIFLSSCLGSKFLKNDQHILAKQKVVGLSGSLEDDAKGLFEQESNSRILFGYYPFTHLAHFHQLGKEGIGYKRNVQRLELRRDDLIEIYSMRTAKSDSGRKKTLQNRLDKKLKNKNDKIERVRNRFKRKISKKENKLADFENRLNEKIADSQGKKKNKLQAKLTWETFKERERIKRLKSYKWIGLWYFDPDIVRAERDSLEAKYDARIASTKKENKIQKLRNRKAKKIDKKNRTIKQGNQLMRWGEKPVIYNPVSSALTAEKIDQYLHSKGYFKSKITIDTSTYDSLGPVRKIGRKTRNWFSRWSGAKKRYINLEYHVNLNNRSVIDSVQYHIQDTVLQALIFENIKDSPLKKGYYDQEVLSEERDFIYDLAVNNGYYEFSKQYIGFQVDSVQLGKDTVIVREVIKNPPGKNEHKIFYLDSIVFVTDASISQSFNRTQEKYRDITFLFGKNRYSKKVLEWRIPLEQDDPYSRDLTIETQRQLSFLDNFKFININYDTTGNFFVANIFTSPFDKYQTSSEFGLSRSQGKPGPFASINLKNRNTFRTLEILSFDANARLEDLPSVREQTNVNRNYTSRQFGAEAAITFPQFLFPLGSYYKNKIGRYNPKTRISFSFSFEDRINEYRRLIYTGRWTYSWQVRDQIKYTLIPFQLSLTDAAITGAEFRQELNDLLEENNPYALAFQSAVVSSQAFQLDLNLGDYANGQDGGFVRLNAELGGNLNNVFGNSLFGDSLETYRFAKAQVDLRKINRLTRKTNLAFRLNVGLAYPYGENQSLPYEKYFFAGGSSSIRAWRPRRLGPGSFGKFEDEEGNPTEFLNDDDEQRGELLIESSVELRQDLVGFLEGAIFIDAGNIWLVRNAIAGVDEDGDDGIFRFNEFTNDIAVGAGVGLRFDLQFLIFRLDLGMKIIDPAQKPGEHFVGDEIFSDFSRNSQINIGIGYPF